MEKTPSMNIYFRGATPFKLQVNFENPLFEVKINVDALEKGYFFVQNFPDKEKITFALLKAVPHVKN